VALAGTSLGVGIALVVASDARARRLKLEEISRTNPRGLGFRF